MKSIVIVGGGISGLVALHHLRKKYASDQSVTVQLFEKESHAGGAIHSIEENGFLFETGPNGFLNNQPAVFDLARDLGLESELIAALPTCRNRFVRLGNDLYPFPNHPLGLLGFKPLSVIDKLRILCEPWVKPQADPRETVYDFAVRRFGKGAANFLFDPLAHGIFGGDVRQLNMKESFALAYSFEETHGSVTRGLLKSRKGQPKRRMHSFRKGMGTLIKALYARNQSFIQLGKEITDISFEDKRFILTSSSGNIFADELFLCVPAPVAAILVKRLNPVLAQQLQSITYAPIAVVGLAYRKQDFPRLPEGFGYLIPSSQNNPVLGVVFENNVFEGRAPDTHLLIRVMIGGTLHPHAVHESKTQLLATAHRAIQNVFGGDETPVYNFIKTFPQAIPQYDTRYSMLKKDIDVELLKTPQLHLLANYYKGISFNDCIKNALQF